MWNTNLNEAPLHQQLQITLPYFVEGIRMHGHEYTTVGTRYTDVWITGSIGVEPLAWKLLDEPYKPEER